jgi:hypothetical protein
MTEPTIEQIKNMVAVTEQWTETKDGKILLSRWIENARGERVYLVRNEETSHLHIPYSILDLRRSFE